MTRLVDDSILAARAVALMDEGKDASGAPNWRTFHPEKVDGDSAARLARRVRTALGGEKADVDQRRTAMRIRHDFDAADELVDPLLPTLLAGIDVDARAAIVLAHVSGSMIRLRHAWGDAVIGRRGLAGRDRNVPTHVGGGVPIGPDVRLTAYETGRRAVHLTRRLPDTVLAGMVGRPLADVLTHPITDPMRATVVEAQDSSTMTGASMVPGSILVLDVAQPPMRWRDAVVMNS